jgi:hypothetical protein
MRPTSIPPPWSRWHWPPPKGLRVGARAEGRAFVSSALATMGICALGAARVLNVLPSQGDTMNRRSVLSTFAITALGLAWLPGSARAQQKSLKEQITGTWSYVSSNAKGPDGSPLWGANPKGLFILTDSGHFSWQVFRSDRPKFASNLRQITASMQRRMNSRAPIREASPISARTR